MPDNQELVLRHQWESYMQCGTGDTATYKLIGEGFTTFPEKKNPKKYTRKYVNYATERSDVISYAPNIAYSCDVITNEPVVAEIVRITDNELVGTDTHRNIVSVNLWEKTEDGKYTAYMRTFSVVPDGKGDGTDAMVYTGTMESASDQVAGTFDRETKKFTPASAG